MSPIRPENGCLSSVDFVTQKFNTLQFSGRWEGLIGNPTQPFKIMMYGAPGSGKSTLSLMFAGYLAKVQSLKVLYVASEEGYNYTLQEKMERVGAVSERLSVTDSMPADDKLTEYDVIFIDSVNDAELEPEQLQGLPGNLSYVYVFQCTKDGRFRGSNKFLHDVDVSIKVEGMVAVTEKNRFGANGRLEIM